MGVSAKSTPSTLAAKGKQFVIEKQVKGDY